VFVTADLLAGVEGECDLIVANAPYIADPARRAYRDGGGTFGTDLSERIVAEAVPRLRPDGQLLLYTGAPFVDGQDRLRRRLAPLLEAADVTVDYDELDPDVFGEELEQPAYAEVERIAVVCIDIRRRRK
ncbi:MAG: class I SAM-dependent methyltransferase, partial [Myxococcales bacterium]|nr:class I SAM-dependent methyltransferase [Myxococcales bacterium]